MPILSSMRYGPAMQQAWDRVLSIIWIAVGAALLLQIPLVHSIVTLYLRALVQ